ncbi:MAG TPA: hypothetical protein VHQ39_08050 [Dongiaceae bacterium]|jgi:hypothetical protein|nr:hypothetical protein [Dongiaceae bacterium]
MTIYVIEADGSYVGGFSEGANADAALAVQGRTAVQNPPSAASAKWNGTAWVDDIAVLIDIRRSEVDALLLAKSVAGVKIPNVPAPIQVRDGDRANIDGQALFATLAKSGAPQWPADSYWRLADNSNFPLATADAMIGFAAAIAGAYLALRKASWTHKDAIAALKTAADVAAYDITAGW